MEIMSKEVFVRRFVTEAKRCLGDAVTEQDAEYVARAWSEYKCGRLPEEIVKNELGIGED